MKKFERGIRVFCDQDGVLADFTKGVQEKTKLLNKALDQKNPLYGGSEGLVLGTCEADYEKYDQIKQELTKFSLFRNLPKTKICDALYETLLELDGTIIEGFEILTSAGRVNRRRVVFEKNQWIRKNLAPAIPVTCTFSGKQKAMFVADKNLETSVLIDDREKNCVEWYRAGGIALLVNDKSFNVVDAIKEYLIWLDNVGYCRPDWTLGGTVVDLTASEIKYLETSDEYKEYFDRIYKEQWDRYFARKDSLIREYVTIQGKDVPRDRTARWEAPPSYNGLTIDPEFNEEITELCKDPTKSLVEHGVNAFPKQKEGEVA
tara:strand:+ start:481 stop:1434 length:954 start_codon:yes stop_codon:yes gene_type:complete